jgi:membrane dipeptidase
MRPLIDAHLDLAWNALSFNRDLTLPLDALRAAERGMTDHPCRGRATVSLPELSRGGVAVCLGTVLARCNPGVSAVVRTDLDHRSPAIAFAAAQGQLAYYRMLVRHGHVTMIDTAQALKQHWTRCVDGDLAGSPLGLILSMEGTDPIVAPDDAKFWWDQGLRVAGLCHYGRSAHAVGTGDDGPLTPVGIELLRVFERLGMILDVTHLSDMSFDEALDRFAGPVLASHSNCRALVPDHRQFSDGQLKRLIDRGAVIGTALDAWMLYPGWERGMTSPSVVGLEAAADHIDHVCQLAGNVNHAAIGSDLDGGFGTEQTPHDLSSIADLQKLYRILSARGYSDADVDVIFHGNWMRFFLQHLPGI